MEKTYSAAQSQLHSACWQTKEHSNAKSLADSLKSYLVISKPTISLLVVVTALPCAAMAAKIHSIDVNVFTLVMVCLGTFMSSSSAAMFNHIVERNSDKNMQRTKKRPLATGKINPAAATIVAITLQVSAFCLLYHTTNALTAWTSVVANVFYVAFYTMYLKPRTAQNIVIGGAAGAVGPLIGWAAVTGSFSLLAWILFVIIFLWTPPHFWTLALKYKADYAAANIPMYPVVYGDAKTRRAIFDYTLVLSATVIASYLFTPLSLVYLAIALPFTIYFLYAAFKLWQDNSNRFAMPLFHYSCFYLFGVFGAIGVDWLI